MPLSINVLWLYPFAYVLGAVLYTKIKAIAFENGLLTADELGIPVAPAE